MVPAILIGTAIILIFWGISSQPGGDETASSVEIPITENTTEESTDNSESDVKIRRHSIDLNLGPESNTTAQAQITPRPIKQGQPQSRPEQTEPEIKWVQTKIRRGDSTARVFSRHGLSARELFEIMELGKDTAILKRIQAGHLFEYSVTEDGSLYGIRYHIDKLNTLVVMKAGDSWQANTESKVVEMRHANASGVIESSLFLAGKKAGLTDAMVMELAGIFGWDIDFILDIRQGDRFTLIYEEKYVEGEKYGNGQILAAEFVNQNKSFRAVLYTDSKGNSEYFSPEGYSMRKAFLRAPLDFSHVSSPFNPRRFHPVLKTVRPHRGIDYAAPIGTPIKAAGDGKVIRSAYDKLNGHHVFIQHGQKYTTKYLHLNKRTVRTGQRVKQGKKIGTLGRTGRVTGAHLHYEFLVNGVHRNPRTVKLPDAEPVAKTERPRFLRETQVILAQLDKHVSFNEVAVANAD